MINKLLAVNIRLVISRIIKMMKPWRFKGSFRQEDEINESQPYILYITLYNIIYTSIYNFYIILYILYIYYSI